MRLVPKRAAKEGIEVQGAQDNEWGIWKDGGSIGENKGLVSRGMSEAEAREEAKRRNGDRSQGEKEYYRLRYRAVRVTQDIVARTERMNQRDGADESVAVEHNNELVKGFVIYDTEQDDYFAGGGRYPNKVHSIHSAVKYTTPEEAQEVIDDFRERMSNERRTIPEGKWVVKPYDYYALTSKEDVEDVPAEDPAVTAPAADVPVEPAPEAPAKMTGAERYARDRSNMEALFAQNKGKPQYYPEEIYALYPIKENDGIRQGVKAAAMADYKATGDKASKHVHEFLTFIEIIRSTNDKSHCWDNFVMMFKEVTSRKKLGDIFADIVKTWCAGFRNKAAIARAQIHPGNLVDSTGKVYSGDEENEYLIEIWTRWREIDMPKSELLLKNLFKDYDKYANPRTRKEKRKRMWAEEAFDVVKAIRYALRGMVRELFEWAAENLGNPNVARDYFTAADICIDYVKVFTPAA